MIRLNTPVLLFSLAVAMLTALLFGLVPALQTAKRDIVEPLKDGGKGVGRGLPSRQASTMRSSSWRSRCRCCCSSAPAC